MCEQELLLQQILQAQDVGQYQLQEQVQSSPTVSQEALLGQDKAAITSGTLHLLGHFKW